MREHLNKIAYYIVVEIMLILIILGYLFNIKLFAYFTLSHICLSLTLYIFSIHLSINLDFLSSHKINNLLIDFISICLISISFIGLIGIKIQGLESSQNYFIAISWLFLLITFYIGYYFSSLILSDRMAWTATILCLILSMYALYCIFTYRYLSSGALRYSVNELLPGGINGFMYGLAWLQTYSITLMMDNRYTKLLKGLAFTSIVTPIILSLVLGSRQYIIAVILMILMVFSGLIRRRIISIKKMVFLASITIGIFYLSLQIEFINVIFSQRLGQTHRHLIQGYVRFNRWGDAIKLFDWDNLFGYGIGYASETLGYNIDNFYIEFLLDYGLVAFFVLIISFIIIIAVLFYRLRNKFHFDIIRMRGIYMTFMIFLAFFWFGNFNEVIREYFLWMIIGVLIAYSEIDLQDYTIAKQNFAKTSSWMRV